MWCLCQTFPQPCAQYQLTHTLKCHRLSAFSSFVKSPLTVKPLKCLIFINPFECFDNAAKSEGISHMTTETCIPDAQIPGPALVPRTLCLMTVFLCDARSCCGCLVCRSWWLRWRLRLSVQRSTALTTRTGPSPTTPMCGCSEGDTSTRTSSARTNMSNTTSTVTCRTNWVSAHCHFTVCVCVCVCLYMFGCQHVQRDADTQDHMKGKMPFTC